MSYIKIKNSKSPISCHTMRCAKFVLGVFAMTQLGFVLTTFQSQGGHSTTWPLCCWELQQLKACKELRCDPETEKMITEKHREPKVVIALFYLVF